MEQLNSLIRDASNEFQCHNFQTSLSLYVRCIEKCIQEQHPKYALYNLKSAQAALRTILGDYEKALSILNSVLSQDKQHFLCLLRRSQVYKKQGKFKKALNDLDTLCMFSPDSMQIAAFKLEIKGLMQKPNQGSSSESESQSDIEKVDEQEVLQFSNLKKIDRTSVSIMIPKGRQSRVTISGDKSYFYESNEDQQKAPSRDSKVYNPSFNQKRFIEIDEELDQDQKEEETPVIVQTIKAKPVRGKSILKNRDSHVFWVEKIDPQYKQQQKKLIEKIKNVDGRIIPSQVGSNLTLSEREVQFKKSTFIEEESGIIDVEQKPKLKSSRKSCLKRSSFQVSTEQVIKKGQRRSKFDSMTRNSIDGKYLTSDTKQIMPEGEKTKQNGQVMNNAGSESESESGSQHNIFGSKKLIINEQLRENLGLGSDSVVNESESKQKQKKLRNHSILKTTSIVVKKEAKKKASVFFKQEQQEIKKPERKAKKSVMFTNF